MTDPRPDPEAAIDQARTPEFMERLRNRMEADRRLLARLAGEHQCRYPQPNNAGFPVNQCLDCGSWIIAAPDVHEGDQ